MLRSCKPRRKRLVTRPEPIASGCSGFSRKSVSRASARRRRCWAIVCELLNVVVQCYREGGLAALLAPPQRRGKGAHLAGLQAEMRAACLGGVDGGLGGKLADLVGSAG